MQSFNSLVSMGLTLTANMKLLESFCIYLGRKPHILSILHAWQGYDPPRPPPPKFGGILWMHIWQQLCTECHHGNVVEICSVLPYNILNSLIHKFMKIMLRTTVSKVHAVINPSQGRIEALARPNRFCSINHTGSFLFHIKSHTVIWKCRGELNPSNQTVLLAFLGRQVVIVNASYSST